MDEPMRTLGLVEPQMLIIALFSRRVEILDWAQRQLQDLFGPLCHEGPTIAFTNTRYYERTMGSDLKKRFLAMERLVEHDQLPAIKRQTMELETVALNSLRTEEARPLNIDPGILSLGKFVLATTKDQAHRVYLHGGIFAEVTLRFHDGNFEAQPWTYPDWKLPEVLEFLQKARVEYGKQRTKMPPAREELPPLLVPARE